MIKQNATGAVIICSHCASGKHPIVLAERSVLDDDPVDTGWQFLCNMEEHNDVVDTKIWALDEILEIEPTLKEFMTLPPGTRVVRENRKSSWSIERKE